MKTNTKDLLLCLFWVALWIFPFGFGYIIQLTFGSVVHYDMVAIVASDRIADAIYFMLGIAIDIIIFMASKTLYDGDIIQGANAKIAGFIGYTAVFLFAIYFAFMMGAEICAKLQVNTGQKIESEEVSKKESEEKNSLDALRGSIRELARGTFK